MKRQRKKNTEYIIILVGILLGVLYWFVESFIHFLLSHEGDSYGHSYIEHLVFMEINEFWMRIVFLSALIITSVIIQHLVNKIRRSEKSSIKAYQQVELYKSLLIHDFRNLIQIIQTSAGLLIMNINENNENKGFINTIEEQTIRAKILINNVLKLTNYEGIKETSKINEKYDILEVLRNSIEFIKNSFPHKIIKIKRNFLVEKIYVVANEFLADVFENILHNAISHNLNEIVEIQIDCSKEVIDEIQYLKLEFKDNGIGISDNIKERIFEENHGIPIKSKGLGFGLSLVKKIITLFKGKIWVEDRILGDYSKGSNFVILIPLNTIFNISKLH